MNGSNSTNGTDTGDVCGVGVDIVAVDRFRDEAEESGSAFRNRVFSSEERADCRKGRTPAQSFAGRYALKEAVLKALPGTPISLVELDTIQITKAPDGTSVVKLPDELREAYDVHGSISHERSYAIGFAVVHAGPAQSDDED